jgi:LCP family protein required for cell wall assembly
MKKLRQIIIIFITIIILFLISSIIAFGIFSRKINQNTSYLIETFKTAYSQIDQIDNPQNFLILGLDPRDDKLEKTEVTDTIILASLNTQNSQFTLISLPRDLWDYQNDFKINHIYQESQTKDNSFTYIKDNYSRLTGQKIDKVIIITTQNLIDFVNLIGGVNLYLENGFVDKEFPNESYINNPSSTIPMYKTVEFPQGWITINDSNVTEFVRSRKSSDDVKSGGTDLARIQRQQLLIEAIIDKVKSKEFLQNTSNLIKLYNFWHQDIDHNIADSFLLSLFFKMGDNLKEIYLNKIDIPVGENSQDGIIYHPTKFINRQWVFIPNDKNYQSLINFIQKSIN